MAQPTLVASGIENLPEFDADSSITIPVTISGTNPALVVKIGGGSASDVIDTVTYNGVTVPEIVSSGAAGASAMATIFVLAAPATGTNNLVVTVTTPFADIGIIWEVWSGVDQTSPTNDSGGGNNAFQASPRSTAITLGADSVGIDCIAVNGASAPVLTAGGTQTQQGQYVARAAASYITSGSSMSWTWAGGSSQQVGHAVVELVGVAGGGDTTAPVLSSPVGTATGPNTATVGATTDEGNGTLYVVVTTSATQPSVAQIKAGNDHAAAAAAYDSTQAISSTGAKTFSATGLSPSTTYYAHLVHTDAAANDSNVVSSASFTTSALPSLPLSGMKIGKFVSAGTDFANNASTNYVAQVYADGTTLGSVVYTSGTLTTSTAGAFTVDLESAALTVSATYKVALTNQSTNETTVIELVAE